MRKLIAVVTMTALLFSFVAPAFNPVARAADAIVYSENFESMTVGQSPEGWTVGTSDKGTATVQNAVYGEFSENRAFKFAQTSMGKGGMSATRNFEPVSGTVTVSAKMMASQTNGILTGPILRSSDGTELFQIRFDQNKVLRQQAITNVGTYEVNQWIDVKVVANTNTDKYDLYIDGVKKEDDYPFKTPVDNIASIGFSAYQWTTGSAFYDNIVVSVAENMAPTASDAVIAGTAAPGETLTGYYAYSDAEGDAQGASSYQWYRADQADGSDRTEISGATALTYTATAADAGKYVIFEVTPAAATGTALGLPVPSVPVLIQENSGPTDPTDYQENFDGTEAGQMPVGWVISVDGDSVSVVDDTYGNRYLSLAESANAVTTSASLNITPIQASFSVDLRLMAEQTGKSANFLTLKDINGVKFVELIFDQDYDHSGRRNIARRTSDGNWSSLMQYNANQWYDVHVDVNMPMRTFSVMIDGNPVASNIGFITTSPIHEIATFSLNSYRNDKGTYNIDDLRIRKVPNQKPAATSVSISGTPAVNQTLTGRYIYSDVEGDAEGTTTFKWYVGTKSDGSDKAAIAGVENASYLITPEDEGKYIFFEATAVALTGGTQGLPTLSTPVLVGPPLAPDAETILAFEQLTAEIGLGKFAPLQYATGIALDGDFEKWRSYTGVELPSRPDQIKSPNWAGADDLSAEAYYAYDANNFYFAVKVKDDVHHPIPGGSNWSGDGIQFSFGEPAFAAFHTEYGVSYDGTTEDIARYNDGMASLTKDAVQMNFTQNGNETIYEMAIPWGAVISTSPTAGQVVPFTFLVNDNDGSGRKGYIEWTGGIGSSKDVGLFARVELMEQDEAWSSWILGTNQVNSGESPQFALYIPNFSDSELNLTLDIPSIGVNGHNVTIPAGQLFKKTFSKAINTAQTIAATITEPSTQKHRIESHRVDVIMTAGDIEAILTEVDAVNQRIIAKLAQAAAEGIPTDYETVNETVIVNFTQFARQDLAQNSQQYLSRAQYMAQVLTEMSAETEAKLDAYLAGTATAFEVPRYVTGPTTIQDYSMIGDTTTEEDWPIFFTGYGMFGQVITDIPKFQGYGTNIIDYNVYPNEMVSADSGPSGFKVSMGKVNNVLLPALADAEANNIAVNIDLAVHGFPDSLFTKFPDLKNPDNLFAHKFDFEHPKATEVLQAYIDAMIPAIKDSPALKGITLTSEPNYFMNKGAYHRDNWHAYLAEHYASAAEMNGIYGSSYANFADVPVPDMNTVTGTPMYYDYLTFKTEQFVEFHQMLADRVHMHAPGLPVHIKIMGWGATHRDPLLQWGYDIEAFSELTEISGNDNGILEEEGPGGYLNALGLYDLQASMAKKPIFNSEDHINSDGDPRYIPEIADSVKNSLWAGAMHGRTMSTVWVWQRDYSGNNNWKDSIKNRPDAAANVGHVNLDLNRLAKEVTAFQEAPAKAALLWSFTPNLYSPNYYSTLKKAYGALSYTGQKVAYISEKQIDESMLDQYELLVLPEVSHLSAETVASIRSWVEAGGKVVTIGSPSNLLQADEHNQPLSATDRDAILNSANTTQVATNPSQEALRSIFFSLLDELNLNDVIVYDAATNQPVNETEWRTVEYNGQKLLSLINFSQIDKTVYVKVNGELVTPVKELISGASSLTQLLPLGGLEHFIYELPEVQSLAAHAVLAGKSIVKQGETYELTLSLDQVRGSIVGADFKVAFDSDEFEFVSAEALKPGYDVIAQTPKSDGIRFLMASPEEEDAVAADGSVLKLTFKAKERSQPVLGTITVLDHVITNVDGVESVVQSAEQQVMIRTLELGDMNGDGKFTIGDLGLMVRLYGTTSADSNWNLIADMKEDGVINIIDLAMLAAKILED